METVFIDTDIALDVLAQRRPFYAAAAKLFTLADQGKLIICISSLSFGNLNYILSRQYSESEARTILHTFMILVKVLPVDGKTIEFSLNSKFRDLEDAIQYFTAVQNHIPTLITRNLKDYKHARIKVMMADEFLLSLQR